MSSVFSEFNRHGLRFRVSILDGAPLFEIWNEKIQSWDSYPDTGKLLRQGAIEDGVLIQEFRLSKCTDADDDSMDPPSSGKTTSVGVGLRESEIVLLDGIAARVGVSRNAIMRYAVRSFLRDFASGKIDLSKDIVTDAPKKRLRMPGL